MANENHGLTAEELAQLTEEERAGLEEEGDDDTDEQNEGDGDGDEQQDHNDDNAADPAGSKAADADADPAAQAGRDDGADAEIPEVPESVDVPLIRAQDTTQARERLDAIRGEKDDLETRFEDGDITAKEYRAGLDKLNEETSALQWTLNKADLSAEVEQQAKVRAWYADVGEYLGNNPDLKASKLKIQAFDTIVREVTADPENAKLSNRAQLAKAHEIWARELGQPAPKAGKREADPTPKPAQRQPASRNAPPTLGKVPAAAVNDTDDGRYAHLDRLSETDPIAFEEAMAKMTEAEQDAYLASN